MDVTDIRRVIDSRVEELKTELRAANHQIHKNPEILWQEHKAHNLLCGILESHGFEVERAAFSLPTAFRATYGPAGARAIAINLEYDALPVIGHACGHNLIATAGLTATLSLAAAVKAGNVHGRVVALGTPAEEGGGGKIKMIRAGAYKDIFCCLMVHASQQDNAYFSSMCGSELTIEFVGKEAHAMAAPWDGINALDAITIFHTSIGLLRQQIMPSDRIRGVVLNAGHSSGIIPAHAKARYCVRSKTLQRYKVLKRKFVNCLEAAALATGCELRTEWMPAYWDVRANEKLATRYIEHMQELGVVFRSMEEQINGTTCASTDMGNVSYECPSIHALFKIDSPNGAWHTAAFEKAASTDDSHERALLTGKAMAKTGLDVLMDESFAAAIESEFKAIDKSVAQDPWVA